MSGGRTVARYGHPAAVAWSQAGRASQRPKRGAEDRNVDVSDLTSRIACIIPRGDGSTAPSIPPWDGGRTRQVDDFIVFSSGAAKQRSRCELHPSTEEDLRHGTDGAGIRCPHCDTRSCSGARTRKVSPFFIPAA